ncbi:hypothetical protein HAT86_16735 [Roseovarius gahaiensis]|uniref:SH3 domain-containing protein n=1 Tax=Roseovarius gahaiensis TaxID=2716691 RepID=A0A967EHL9_9RHOB|nr:hypothetical protein [Roseovarius gahaiensis]NHQ76085.1 hypothetical protein [Roseovarius gahaiensis]
MRQVSTEANIAAREKTILIISKKITLAGALSATIGLACCASLSAANAAIIQFKKNEEMGCSISVEGVIESGDAEKLGTLVAKQRAQDRANGNFFEFMDSPSGRRICFDSPGGNMVEAMAMAEIISGGTSSRGPGGNQLGTAVGRNARCESACALAFMAGSWARSEGEVTGPNRVIHPTSRLGFHRPNLVVSSGSYSEKEIDAAFGVALDTISLVIKARTANWLDFPESLFSTMLSTPHSGMYFIETVGEAARLSIQVAPTSFFNGASPQAILNFCNSVDASLLDTDPPSTYMISSGEIELVANAYDRWTIPSGFREEAVSGCTVAIFDAQRHATDPVGYAFIGDYDVDRRKDIWPFQSFPSETQISMLERATPLLAAEFIKALRNSSEKTNPATCWLTGPSARIANVKEYVNLRRRPDFSAPVIRQVPLSERVRATRADNITVIGQERDRQSCINACQAFGANSEDGNARDRVQQCIDDNMLWYEITDARGNRGWVSRKFLEEVE